jgi:hypothetical protein
MEQTNPTIVITQTEAVKPEIYPIDLLNTHLETVPVNTQTEVEQTKTDPIKTEADPAKTEKDWLSVFETDFVKTQSDILHSFEISQMWQILNFYYLRPSFQYVNKKNIFFQIDICQVKVNMVLDNSIWSVILDDCDRVIFICQHQEAIRIPWRKQLDTKFIRKCQMDQMRVKLREDKFVFEEKRHCEEGEPHFSIQKHGQDIIWALDNNKWYLTPEGGDHVFICTHGVALNAYWKPQLDNIGSAHVKN